MKHGIPFVPVPVTIEPQPPEQVPVALKGLFWSIHEPLTSEPVLMVKV